MLTDANLLFSNAQNLAQTAATYLSTNSVDFGVAGTDVQGGTALLDPARVGKIRLLCQVVTTFTSGGSATVQFVLVMADDAALTSNLTILDQTDVLAYTVLVAGYKPRLGLPAGGISKRYVGMQYIIGTATTTAGKVTSGLVVDVDTQQV